MHKELLDQIIIAILIPAIPLLGYYLKLWVSEQINNLKEKRENEKVNFYLSNVEKLIFEVVNSVNQSYVDTLKEKGLFNEEAHIKVFNIAKNKILELTQTEGKEVVESLYGDYVSYIEMRIDDVVKNLKE